jgi:hypothetical protein
MDDDALAYHEASCSAALFPTPDGDYEAQAAAESPVGGHAQGAESDVHVQNNPNNGLSAQPFAGGDDYEMEDIDSPSAVDEAWARRLTPMIRISCVSQTGIGMAPKTATSKAGQSGDTGLIKVANSHVDDKGASAKACANTAAAQNVPVTGNADAANEHAGGDAGTKTDDEPQATGPAPKRDAHVDDDAAAGNVDTKNGADPDVPTESVTKPKGDVTEPPAKPNTEAVVVQAGGSVVNFFDLTYGPNAEEPIENEVKICIDRMSSDTAFKKYSTIEKKAYMTTQKQNAVDKALLQGRFAFENELKKQVAKLTKDLNDQQILAERALTRRMSARLDGIDNDVCKAKKPRKRKHPDK